MKAWLDRAVAKLLIFVIKAAAVALVFGVLAFFFWLDRLRFVW